MWLSRGMMRRVNGPSLVKIFGGRVLIKVCLNRTNQIYTHNGWFLYNNFGFVKNDFSYCSLRWFPLSFTTNVSLGFFGTRLKKHGTRQLNFSFGSNISDHVTSFISLYFQTMLFWHALRDTSWYPTGQDIFMQLGCNNEL